eukprot:TRINITY_DN3236_c0_g1_i2.p1 TRINITY_DN3236_c0_g1~~TRINITY_DN3236_c0_g1_i2.p1  ORF type:complete len:356 (-),score=72.40 TRINITY_DN3236_c0_g1_i2:70-1137(-)
MSSEKFCLRWNDFESNISVAFRELRDDKDFFDVTLACDDEQISAHKVILSACSPFFRNILRRNPHQHPLLYLKGVKYTDLQSVLNFMYHGEVNVAQEELNSFLAVAEDLRVKGLTQNQGGASSAARRPKTPPPVIKASSRPPDREIHPPPKRPRPADPPRNTISSLPNISTQSVVDDDDIQEVVPVKSEPRDPLPLPPSPMVASTPIYHAPSPVVSTPQPSHSLAPVDDQTLAYQDESYEDYGQYEADQSYDGSMVDTGMMAQGADGNKGHQEISDPSDLLQFVSENFGQGEKRFKCSMCDMFSHNGRAHVRNHIESKHFPNHFMYSCEQCEKTFTSKSNFAMHKSRAHKGQPNW